MPMTPEQLRGQRWLLHASREFEHAALSEIQAVARALDHGVSVERVVRVLRLGSQSAPPRNPEMPTPTTHVDFQTNLQRSDGTIITEEFREELRPDIFAMLTEEQGDAVRALLADAAEFKRGFDDRLTGILANVGCEP